MKGKKLFTMLIVTLGFLFTGYIYAQVHFKPVDDTGLHSAIVIQNATINGVQIQTGDEIGVFDGTLCVGAAVFGGSFPVSIAAILEYTPQDNQHCPEQRQLIP